MLCIFNNNLREKANTVIEVLNIIMFVIKESANMFYL